MHSKEFIIIDTEKKLLFKFRKYPVPLFSMLPRLHPVSATRRQGLILRKVYGKCDWRQVAETGCKGGRLENKGTGFEASLHPLGAFASGVPSIIDAQHNGHLDSTSGHAPSVRHGTPSQWTVFSFKFFSFVFKNILLTLLIVKAAGF